MSLHSVHRMAPKKKTPREAELEVLELFFKKCMEYSTQEDAEGDDLANFREYWNMFEAKHVEFWSLKMIAITCDVCLITKHMNAKAYLLLTYMEKVKDINAGNGSIINVHRVTTNTEWAKQQ